jgi:putative membrane protein insertion efficiency factor
MCASRAAVGLIRLYQRTVSRLLPGVCRFQPTCSQYAVEALQRYGFWRGGWLALRRLSRCHPWNPGGYDPVPERQPAPAADDETKHA